MTEPVAYLNKYQDDSTNITRYKPENQRLLSSNPLYTADQLHLRVKMTKNQHKQFENYKVDKNNFYHFWQSLLVDEISLLKEFSERELMFVWLDEEAVEIIPDMKWFVRSKEQEKGLYWYLKKTERFFFHEYIKEIATPFDTKEQAERWTNPLTEAVQLPVEDE